MQSWCQSLVPTVAAEAGANPPQYGNNYPFVC
jgi:hypothetical protein